MSPTLHASNKSRSGSLLLGNWSMATLITSRLEAIFGGYSRVVSGEGPQFVILLFTVLMSFCFGFVRLAHIGTGYLCKVCFKLRLMHYEIILLDAFYTISFFSSFYCGEGLTIKSPKNG